MSNEKIIDLEPLEIIKQLEEDRKKLQDLVTECTKWGMKKAEAEAEYKKCYSEALRILLNDGNKYTNVLLIEFAKGRVAKEYEKKEKIEIYYESLKETIRCTKVDMETLRTYLSYQKEISKIV